MLDTESRKLYGLDLFSGYGGITLGISTWVRPIAYCEIDPYARSILLTRMSESALPIAPVWDDVQTLTRNDLPIQPEIIYGGFPCQDLSVAGLGAGLAGKRSGLFYEIARLTKEINPRFVFLENVTAIRTNGLRDVARTFTEMGYDCRWTCISAASVGAPHKRERWFLLASNTNGNKLRSQQVELQECQNKAKPSNNGQKKYMANTMCKGLEGQWQITGGIESQYENTSNNSGWEVEPRVGRMVNGVTDRVDRIKALGNGVVPAQVEKAFKMLVGLNA
jgi:DNA (cytosine-5)-methyltransferase 1